MLLLLGTHLLTISALSAIQTLLRPPSLPRTVAVAQGENVHVNMRRIGVAPNGMVPDFTNLGVAAAIVDTGIDRRHPDLNIVGGKNLCSSETNGDPYNDGLGHGTHVAGILGAKNNGQGIIGAAPGGVGGVWDCGFVALVAGLCLVHRVLMLLMMLLMM